MPPPALPASGTTSRFRLFRTVSALMLREMGSRYGRSPGGYIWALLEPLGMIAILSLAFALVARSPPIGTSFILFFGSGYTIFSLYQTLANTISRAMKFSRALLNYPIIHWIDPIIARFLLNTMTGILVMYVIMTGITLSLDDPILIDIRPIVEAIFLTTFLGFGVGMLNCFLISVSPAWENIWTILNRPLFLVSGVIFLYEDMPPLAQEVVWYNPLLHIIGLMRRGFYPTYEAPYVSVAYVAGFALITLFFGTVFMRRYHRVILAR
ncbi:ABC transporter permease [Tateyamaria sp. SN6-1]|uniref:ABC transporter permease n=1 Tax=Tateyamaria sp. SN6-1 TaxID=3092148 RepID=UPI0039F611D4